MNAKDKQKEFIKTYLKPKLKEEGYNTAGQNWWKNKGDFFITINLQNSQWNSVESLSFCFNIGVALTEKIKDPEKKKATYYDAGAAIREDGFLPDERKKHKYRKESWLGYIITNDTDLEDFSRELKIDFEEAILPKLNNLDSLEDCLSFFKQFGFWGENLKKQIEEISKT
ncbi:DUF4304 domain-containing protein [Pontibacter silvestris]|uniref:DUF4304 domain-containing protein n=1 Tax=Pontibacter silvestris TaxID=2305183 RepID=A0ABW4WXQ7_9BACT|nr:DUF4304 domain-containing protein [Pontibacter silvestris]MCC9138936.1 DUF4304 domain-containing protein [Pontibacter silvestris]